MNLDLQVLMKLLLLIYNEDIINIYNSIGGKAKVKPVFCVDGNVYKLSNTDMPINNLVIFLVGYIEGSAK